MADQTVQSKFTALGGGEIQLVKARMTKWVKHSVLNVSEWNRVGKGIGLRPAAAPKKDGKRHALETLRHNLFTCVAILGRSGRHKVLRLSAGDAWLFSFHAALTRLLAPLANCKAGAIEGPLMALMA